jgi:hypothetical protein
LLLNVVKLINSLAKHACEKTSYACFAKSSALEINIRCSF